MDVNGTTTLDQIFLELLRIKADDACSTLGIEKSSLLEAFGANQSKSPEVGFDDCPPLMPNKKSAPKKSVPPKKTPVENDESPDVSRCGYIMVSGKRVGEVCGKPARASFSGIGACSLHEKKVEEMGGESPLPKSSKAKTGSKPKTDEEELPTRPSSKPKITANSKKSAKVAEEKPVLKKAKQNIAPATLTLKKYNGKHYAEIDGVKVAFDAKTKKAIGYFDPGTDDLEPFLSQRQVESIEAMGHYVDESVEIKTYKKEKHVGSDDENTDDETVVAENVDEDVADDDAEEEENEEEDDNEADE